MVACGAIMRAKLLRKEIIPLTTLRGIAAMAVIAMHFSASMQTIASGKFPSLAPHASLAVDVFFVLSGFIMGYTYLASFRSQDLWTAYRNFLGKRAARILPLNVAITIALVVVALAALKLFHVNPVPTVRPDHVFEDVLTNAFLLPGIGIGHSFNWPAWSISVEFAAYFAFPLLLALVFHRKPAIFLLTCLIAAFGLFGAVGPDFNIVGMHNHPWPWRDLLRCVSEFVLGLAMFRLHASGRLTSIFSRDSVALGVSAAILAIVLSNASEVFAMLLFPALILSLSLNRGRVAALLSTPIPYFLGEISYSLYLVTDPFRWPAMTIVRALHPAPIAPHMAMALAAMFTLLMIAPAWVTYSLVERPGRLAVRSLLARRAGRQPLAAPQAGPRIT
jgi:peptidoglycan/LPS O-acetylase OafA/YrhL